MPRLPQGATPPTTVLVADDDEDMRALVASTLRDDGYEVTEARDGADLLAQLEAGLDDPSRRPDVVISDVIMPELSGLGVLEALRRAQQRLPVILMTVVSDETIHTVAKRLGAVGVLRKPFDFDDLRTAIVNAFIRDTARSRTR
jgi:two-component system, OmpR family, response regulator